MNINTYGKDERLKFCREYIYKKCPAYEGDITLLPIPTTKDGETLHGVGERLDDICERQSAGDAVVGYNIPVKMRERLAMVGAFSVDISLDEEFVCDNAELTAIGTVGRILTEHKSAPKDMRIGIIGYGRIGKKLLNLFLFLGANVTVYTTKEKTRIMLCERGISAKDASEFDTDEGKIYLSELDFLINTAPAVIIPEGCCAYLGNTRVIELASGDNIPACAYPERFPSVPAQMYPKSAGFAMGASVLRMLGLDNERK